jgi:hypothetical protein
VSIIVRSLIAIFDMQVEIPLPYILHENVAVVNYLISTLCNWSMFGECLSNYVLYKEVMGVFKGHFTHETESP